MKQFASAARRVSPIRHFIIFPDIAVTSWHHGKDINHTERYKGATATPNASCKDKVDRGWPRESLRLENRDPESSTLQYRLMLLLGLLAPLATTAVAVGHRNMIVGFASSRGPDDIGYTTIFFHGTGIEIALG